MKKFTHKKTTSEAVSIKGVVSPDGGAITFEDEKGEKTVNITDVVNIFAGLEVDFKISTKVDEEVDGSEY